MTNKMVKILLKAQKRIDNEKWLYENGFIDFKKLQSNLNQETKMFTEMITGMFHYGLLSESDFAESYSKVEDMRDKVISEIIGL